MTLQDVYLHNLRLKAILCCRAAYAVKMAKQLSVKAEEKHINDADDSGSQGSLPHDQDQSTKTSISVGSFPQGQVSLGSEDMSLPANYVVNDKMENILPPPTQDTSKSLQGVEDVKKQDDHHVGPSASSERDFQDFTGNPVQVQATDSQSSASFPMIESPLLSEKSSLKVSFTPSPSPVVALASWLGSNYNESKSSTLGSPSLESYVSVNEVDASSERKSGSQGSSAANAFFTVSPKLLLETDETGYGGGPCSAGASAVLDFMAEALADLVTEQIKAVDRKSVV